MDMIRNGLYALCVELQDGRVGGDNGVVVLRDGTIRGGDSFFYFVGRYSCSGGKWKGEVISQEHTPALATRPFARKIATIGFTGIYTDGGAECDNTALLGKQSVRFKTSLRLLVAD
jgi:T3SS negative regulator,GrlR